MHITEKACKCGSLSYSSLWCTNIPVSTQFSLLKINSSTTSHGPIDNPLSLLRVTFYRQLSIHWGRLSKAHSVSSTSKHCLPQLSVYNFDNLSAYSQMQKRISLTQDHWRRHLVRKKRKNLLSRGHPQCLCNASVRYPRDATSNYSN